MNPHPFLDQIDHVGIHSEDPEPLFRFFTGTLDLPVAFPFVQYPNYTSGSVVLGNIFLELMRFGAPDQKPTSAPPAARYFILGFRNQPGTLAESLEELDRRRIPHSGIVPFFAPEATDQNPIQIWANVYLGDLLGSNSWMRMLFWMTKQATMKPSTQRSQVMNAISLFIMDRAFRRGMPVLTEYYRENDEEKQAADRAELVQRNGGMLGVKAVSEVIVGVPDVDNARRTVWGPFFAPIGAGEAGLYHLGAGPSIRLVPADQPGIRTMVLQVASLERAKAAANSATLSVTSSDERLTLVLPHTPGLTIQLTEL